MGVLLSGLVLLWEYDTAGCLRRPYLFRLAGKEWGEKGRWDAFGASCGYSSGRNLIYRYYEHTYSPYGRFGTRRLLWCTKFVNSCDSISAVKTPCIRNLRGSTNLPESCRGRCLHRPAGKLRIRRRFPQNRYIPRADRVVRPYRREQGSL